MPDEVERGQTEEMSHALWFSQRSGAVFRNSLLAVVGFAFLASASHARQDAQSAPKPVGTIKAIAANSITLTSDSGGELAIQVENAARVLRVEPGQKDLKAATPITLADLKPGDRIIARGAMAADGKAFLATSIITISKGDIAAKQAHDREEWQRHGVGGLVESVDAPGGIITISTSSLGEKKTVAVHVSGATILRRYAPDSTKFDDAKPALLDKIKPGDQLRARGTKSADGGELIAEEIVSGTFRNIAGVISSIDSAGGTLVVQDLATKKPVTIRITPESQLRKLPPPLAQRIALRLKGPGTPSATGTPPSPANAAQPASGGAGFAGGQNGGRQGNGDFQQMISRMPSSSLADLQKGEAVMIVATEGSDTVPSTAITLLAGVEPILQAAPASNSTLLSPWSLGAAPNEPGATP